MAESSTDFDQHLFRLVRQLSTVARGPVTVAELAHAAYRVIDPESMLTFQERRMLVAELTRIAIAVSEEDCTPARSSQPGSSFNRR